MQIINFNEFLKVEILFVNFSEIQLRADKGDMSFGGNYHRNCRLPRASHVHSFSYSFLILFPSFSIRPRHRHNNSASLSSIST